MDLKNRLEKLQTLRFFQNFEDTKHLYTDDDRRYTEYLIEETKRGEAEPLSYEEWYGVGSVGACIGMLAPCQNGKTLWENKNFKPWGIAAKIKPIIDKIVEKYKKK